jgi:hypothetical protein
MSPTHAADTGPPDTAGLAAKPGPTANLTNANNRSDTAADTVEFTAPARR